MLDPPDINTVPRQLIALLKVPILSKGSFPAVISRDIRPVPDEDGMIRNDEFRKLKKATDSLRRSNTVPQDMEIETIECFQNKCAGDISRDDNYIQHLQKQINRLLGEIQTTRSRRLRIQDLSDFFKPICSPVRRLPLEILATIFEFCQPPDAGPHGGAPLVLCHVSSRWRRVALGLRRLWSRLSIDFSQISGSKYNEISKFWFLHARNEMHSLHFLEGQYYSRLFDQQQLSENLKTSSRFIRVLKCTNLRPRLLLSFLRLPSSEVPLLEVIHLSSRKQYPNVTTVLEAAPHLRAVYLNTNTLEFRGVLPWSQLTWLKIVDPMEAEYWTVVFPQCLQLQYGSFQVHFPSAGDFGSAGQITLGHLETLCLIVDDRQDLFESFFQNFNLPSLRHFSLTDLLFESHPHISPGNMIPCPNLVSLCFQGITINLASTPPTLKYLALDISHNSLSKLNRLNRTFKRLPALSHLYLVMTWEDFLYDPRELRSIIIGLCGSSSPFVSLEHVSLFVQRDKEVNDWDEGDPCGYTADHKMEKTATMIMSDPDSYGVDVHVSIVPEPFRVTDVIEEIWYEWPQDY